MIDDYFGRLAARLIGEPSVRLVRPVSRVPIRPVADPQDSDEQPTAELKALPAPVELLDDGMEADDATSEDAFS